MDDFTDLKDPDHCGHNNEEVTDEGAIWCLDCGTALRDEHGNTV